MAIREFSALTWEEARALDGARAVAILPVGAVEAHGPHLPLGTDLIIADAMARAGAERLDARGFDALLLPGIAYTAAPFAAAFPGTLSASADAVRSQIVAVADALEGVAVLAIANAHLDPAHVSSLRAAADEIAAGNRIRCAYPDLTRRRWAERLTEEFRSGACHAGRFETSIVLATRPDLVRGSYSSLPAVPNSLTVAIREGKHTFEEAGGPRAYFGEPAAATAEEGAATIAELGRILEEAVVAALEARHG